MKDSLKRLHCPSLNLRAYTAVTTGISNELCTIHQTTPNATYALAQSLSAAALLSASLKPESNQSLVYKIEGNGPLRSVYVQADSRGGMRGYVGNPSVDHTVSLDTISFSTIIGAGTLTVTKELGLREPYTGVSALLYGSVARDTAYYLASSEQIPSALIIACETRNDGVITAAGGILIQTFPDTSLDVIGSVEERIHTMDESLGKRMENGEDVSVVLSKLLLDSPVQLLSETPLKHRCSCSREVILRSLRFVSTEDLQTMIDEDHGAEVSCTFCKTRYAVTEDEL
ncbi:MAG: Hsp33 family molecular chaperone HslO, partial [Spirochaetota bacterium]